MDYCRRYPIVFVLDTTISMLEKQNDKCLLDQLNDTVRRILVDVITDNGISPYAYVAFVTFADGITLETEFKKPGYFTMQDFQPARGSGQRVCLETLTYEVYGDTYMANIPRFLDIHTETSSRVGAGVLRAVEKLEAYKNQLVKDNVRYYIPLMILITDGAPGGTADEEEERRAIQAVREHCYSPYDCSNFIVPLICGVGKNAESLREYSVEFPQGFRLIDYKNPGRGFRDFYRLVRGSFTCESALKSMFSKPAATPRARAKKDIKKLIEQLEDILPKLED